MSCGAQRPGAWLARSLLGPRLRSVELGQGVTQLLLSTSLTRGLRFPVSPYLLDDLLIDTGFAHAQPALLRGLTGRRVSAIACTHHHEDHTGNCAALVRQQTCPVYLRRAEALREEGVSTMLPYRLAFWGRPEPYLPLEMPAELRSGTGRVLQAIPTPGHSLSHTAFFEEATGLLFTGDLYLSGGATAVMVYENPRESVRSLRRVAELKPRRMLTGHALVLDDPAPRLLTKADRIEEAATRAVELVRQGLPGEEILRRLFRGGHLKDRWTSWLTAGEFSRPNFVSAVLRADAREQVLL